ncbi:PREDICTED: formin-like protein 5 [Tarenaya hassleriana]|uniref:formin-like protein 5 n=1 Tax=Tarenaya hassleriana TaxID=28532 RepID=UPI00053C3AAA|nr:PREDICTED: formin-like protein 5 [Tarenaya hassleriana]
MVGVGYFLFAAFWPQTFLCSWLEQREEGLPGYYALRLRPGSALVVLAEHPSKPSGHMVQGLPAAELEYHWISAVADSWGNAVVLAPPPPCPKEPPPSSILESSLPPSESAPAFLPGSPPPPPPPVTDGAFGGGRIPKPRSKPHGVEANFPEEPSGAPHQLAFNPLYLNSGAVAAAVGVSLHSSILFVAVILAPPPPCPKEPPPSSILEPSLPLSESAVVLVPPPPCPKEPPPSSNLEPSLPPSESAPAFLPGSPPPPPPPVTDGAFGGGRIPKPRSKPAGWRIPKPRSKPHGVEANFPEGPSGAPHQLAFNPLHLTLVIIPIVVTIGIAVFYWFHRW